jgi:hypothetical protein
MIGADDFRALAARLRGPWPDAADEWLFANGVVLSPAVAEITGERRAWTVSTISELSMPCK